MSDDRPKRPDTKLVEAGRRKGWLRGMVNVPVSRTSTVLLDSGLTRMRPTRLWMAA